MHFLSSTYKNINSFNHSGSSDQTMETFWDFINKWNFLNITNVSGIISLTLLILIIGTYLIGLIRLAKKSNLTLIGRTKGKRFLALSGLQKIIYDTKSVSK